MFGKVSKTQVAVLGVAVVVGAVGLSLSQNQLNSDSNPAMSVQPTAIDPVTVSSVDVPQPMVPVLANASTQSPSEIQMLINEIVSKLVNDHAHEKREIAFQITLKEIRDGLLLDYPDKGAEIFERILVAAFPNLAEAILTLIAQKDIYDAWLLSNMLSLNELAASDYNEALWIKRYEIFGKEIAEQLWEPERTESEEREEAMHTVLNILGQSKDVAMHDRVNILKQAYDENYFATVEDLVLDASGVLAQTIFSLEVVQDELHAMTPEQRQAEIDSVRRQLGFDESKIEWLSQRDQEREARWQNGYRYMEERALIEAQYEGEAREAQLDSLRQKYFAEEAPTIEREEELLEFYRYKRPRVYGRN